MRSVQAKKKCCSDKPRCKACPVVLSRLEKAGFAEKQSKTSYMVVQPLPKKAVKRARAS